MTLAFIWIESGLIEQLDDRRFISIIRSSEKREDIT
jgi:hypothetical protein